VKTKTGLNAIFSRAQLKSYQNFYHNDNAPNNNLNIGLVYSDILEQAAPKSSSSVQENQK
jgi:hypothetical protein